MGLELLLAILPPCYWCVRYSAFFLLVDLVLLLAIRVYSASFLLVDLVFCLIAGIVQCSSASFLLMGLVCCLLAIGGIGLLLPFYWWVWTPASSYWWVRASGGSGILPPLLLVGSDLQAPFLNCCFIFCRALLLMIV